MPGTCTTLGAWLYFKFAVHALLLLASAANSPGIAQVDSAQSVDSYAAQKAQGTSEYFHCTLDGEAVPSHAYALMVMYTYHLPERSVIEVRVCHPWMSRALVAFRGLGLQVEGMTHGCLIQ